MAQSVRNEASSDNFESLPLRKTPTVTLEADTHELKMALKELQGEAVPVRNGSGIIGYLKPQEILTVLSMKGATKTNFLQKKLKSDHITVNAEESVFDNLSKVISGPDGPILVKKGSQLLGYIPRGDLFELIIKQFAVSLKDIDSTSQLVTIREDTRIHTAYKNMSQAGTDSAVIVDQEGVLVGIFTNTDLSSLIESGCDLWNTRIDSVMKEPAFVTQNTSLNVAYKVILRTGMDQLVLLNNQGHPEGIVKTDAIQRALHSLSRPTSAKAEEKHPMPPALNQDSKHLPESLIIETVLNRTLETGIVGVDENLDIIYFNPAAKEFLNEHVSLALGMNIHEIRGNVKINKFNFTVALSKAIKNKKQFFSIEAKKDGHRKDIHCKLSTIEQGPDILGYVIAIHDVTIQKKEKQAIKRLAYYDSLTKLPNRLFFNERMLLEIKRVKRKHERMALAVMDLNGFKIINDQYGHLAGDKLLRTVSKRLTKTIRESDTVARFGGDEFTFIFPEIKNIHDAEVLTSKLRQAVSKPIKVNSEKIRISASIGMAFFPNDGRTLKSLLKTADKRMYNEKALLKKHRLDQADSD